MTRPVLAAALVGAIGLVGVFADDDDANAQRFDPRRPSSWVVGPPPGESPMVRVDARRSGRSRSPLPAGPLKVAWRQPTANKTEQPALAGADGTVVVVADNGAVSLLEATGEPRGQQHGDGVALGGPPALTSDGTLVYVTSAGDAFGYQPATGKRWTRRIGAERSPNAAPLPLDDGGAVFASGTDLVVLDADGGVRARVTLPEKPAAPLLGAGDQIVVVTSMGNVYGWVPGREPVRLGSFGAPVDGAAALRDATTLVGVIDGNLLAEVDLVHGGFSTRALAPQGLYLGPPAVRGGFATMLALTPTRSFVVTVDAAGQELLRAPAGSFSQATLADGGAPPLTAPPHVGPIVDDRGAIAFATTDSHVGVVSPDGAVDILGDPLCPTGARGGVVGLTPAGPGRFLVTCEQGGVVLAVTSAGAAGSPAPSRP